MCKTESKFELPGDGSCQALLKESCAGPGKCQDALAVLFINPDPSFMPKCTHPQAIEAVQQRDSANNSSSKSD